MSNWYLQTGKDSDIVISSRARLARNLAEFNFKNSYVKDESIKSSTGESVKIIL